MTFGKDLNLYLINFDLDTVDKLYRFNKICDIRGQIYDCATSYFTDLTYNVCFFWRKEFRKRQWMLFVKKTSITVLSQPSKAVDRQLTLAEPQR